jgi:hypothetical protein
MTKTAREAGVARLAEGFMVPRVWQCDVWEIDGNQGTAYVPAAFEINWEDVDLTCDHCGKHIESAYGETR